MTPAASQVALRAPMSNGLAGTGRKIGRPQRVPVDEYREQSPLTLDEPEDLRARGEWEVRQEEKENLIIPSDGDGLSSDGAAPKRKSPRLAVRSTSVSQLDGRAISGLPTRAYASSSGARQPLQSGRQIMAGPNRAGRVLMGVKYGVGSGGFDKINENEASENEVAIDNAGDETDPSAYLSISLGSHDLDHLCRRGGTTTRKWHASPSQLCPSSCAIGQHTASPFSKFK